MQMTNPTSSSNSSSAGVGATAAATNTSIINIVSSSSHGGHHPSSSTGLTSSHSSPHISDKSSQAAGAASASGSQSVEEIKAGSEVTALHKFKGRASERELSFEFGDLIRIISIVAKDPQWAFAELRGKQGFIPLNYVKPRSVTMPWFHGNITREQAEFVLKDLPEGSYLMRESTHYPGDFTLCLKSESKVENYHIKIINGEHKFTIDDENFFLNLIELVQFYAKYEDLACKLREPVKLTKKKESSDYESLISCLMICDADVTLGKEIGIGEFGAVYKGMYRNTEVAVKKIKDRATVDEFMKEAVVMATLQHPNLVKLIGVVPNSDKTEISLVTEYMPKGSLLDYLMSRGRNVLTKFELLKFVIHICDGMSYLEEKGIVHRDLAASNVLISKDHVAKVSDFGLAKKIMDNTRNGVRIRIKWTAPEAIKDRLYSNKSDMWSFGILLWEIFSYGRVPYPKIPVNEVLGYIEQGNRMEKPDGCPDEIYAIMKEAWLFDRTLRPTFNVTLVKLNKIKALYDDKLDC